MAWVKIGSGGQGSHMTTQGPRLPPAVGAHRVLADGDTAALLRRDGEIDWWCLPRFDSAPVLWSLLDPDGSCARWTDVRGVEWDETPAAPALSTLLRSDTSRIECLDGFVDDALVRCVRALDADLDLTHELGLGGFGVAEPQWGEGSVALPVGTVHVRGGEATYDGGRALHRFRAPRGQWQALVISLDVGPQGDAEVLHERLVAARRTADEGIAAARVPHLHAERCRDALRVLEACAAPTGAVVASLTTSLPEALPGDRQWDYRYSWLRDAALATSAASLLGAGTAAGQFLAFAVGVLGDDPMGSSPVTTVDGGQVPDEVEIDGVAGWGGAQPVRTGNAAHSQVQHDALGLFVEAVSMHVQTGGSVDDATWAVVEKIADGLADLVLDDAIEPSSGVWELREPKLLVSEDVGRWLALDRAVWLGRLRLRRTRRWRTARDVLAKRVLGAIRDDGTLPMAYDEPDGPTDVTALFVPLFGMRRGEQAQRMVLGTLDRLGAGPVLYRYEPTTSDGMAWDGLRGHEATFLPVSFMAVGALAAVGLRDEARDRLDGLCALLPRLIPEMWDPVEDRGLGNVPLVWSHMELARAVYVLDALDRRARWGPVGFALWRGFRYLQLRRSRRGPQVRP